MILISWFYFAGLFTFPATTDSYNRNKNTCCYSAKYKEEVVLTTSDFFPKTFLFWLNYCNLLICFGYLNFSTWWWFKFCFYPIFKAEFFLWFIIWISYDEKSWTWRYTEFLTNLYLIISRCQTLGGFFLGSSFVNVCISFGGLWCNFYIQFFWVPFFENSWID